MVNLAKAFWNDESGQGLAEYALLLGLIVVGVVLIIKGMGGAWAATSRTSSARPITRWRPRIPDLRGDPGWVMLAGRGPLLVCAPRVRV
jgi:Flp pilus assembly pilin Flp